MNQFVNRILLGTAVSLLCCLAAAAQYSVPTHRPALEPAASPEATAMTLGDNFEKAITVDKNVNLSLCVTQGSLKINGWNRGEVRVIVRDGAKFTFNVQAPNPTTKLPALLMVKGAEMKARYPYGGECIWGSEIEIDAPVGAVINVKGKEIHTVVDTVRKASVYIIGGDIIFRNVTEGVTASTGQGDITVEDSTGPMSLETTTGNVVVFDVGPSEIGDIFKAKTNSGSLSLQQLEYRQVEVNSTSGSIIFTGDVKNGANYSMTTLSGSIRMQVPAATNCQLAAVFAAGRFNSDIPFKLVTENIREGSVKKINAKFGKGGEGIVKLTTGNGSIGISKL